MFEAFKQILYIRLSPEFISIRHINTGKTLTCKPLLAIDTRGNRKVLAFGDEAQLQANRHAVQIVNPFVHPRTLLADFTCASVLLKGLIRKVFSEGPSARLLMFSPKIVLHPCVDPEGGFTQVELRALHELCLGTGAAKAIGWQGRALTDQEIVAGTFPNEGKILW